jgi:ABC-type bacteriocin/lantibiotic exporter with double-glycine peptidase domain
MSMNKGEFMVNTPTAVEIDSLTLRFGEQILFQDFSLSVPTGQKVQISGQSGRGKSSLLKSILGFIQPAAGQIRIDGQILDGKSVWAIRKRIGYVAQEPQFAPGAVKDLLREPFQYAANHGVQYDQAMQDQLFERFYLSKGLLDKQATELSGGEKQRVALVGALLLKRPIYLLDEAASALDADSKQAVIDYLRERTDITMVVVSHDTALGGLADKAVSLPNGVQGGRQ